MLQRRPALRRDAPRRCRRDRGTRPSTRRRAIKKKKKTPPPPPPPPQKRRGGGGAHSLIATSGGSRSACAARRVDGVEPSSSNAALARAFAALADPTRCAVVELLRARPLRASDLAAALQIAPAGSSRHLRLLMQRPGGCRRGGARCARAPVPPGAACVRHAQRLGGGDAARVDRSVAGLQGACRTQRARIGTPPHARRRTALFQARPPSGGAPRRGRGRDEATRQPRPRARYRRRGGAAARRVSPGPPKRSSCGGGAGRAFAMRPATAG